jgi:GNAT superfamily N-acetyltransferase
MILANDGTIEIAEVAPSPMDFAKLRAECGWGLIDTGQASTALENSLFIVSALKDQRTIGFGRIIGDGALNFYIQDIVVAADYRRFGIGRAIVTNLLKQLRGSGKAKCSVGLMAAEGIEDFYRQFGFVQRPSAIFGAGMSLDL